jgi:heme O synthase-like polyprenyltransferase
VFVALAARLTITGTRSAAVDLYVYSLLYLAALVVFVVIDSGIG